MKVRNVPLSEIIVDRRIRRDASDVEDLAASIERMGLIHPITVTHDLRLVAGERRMEAFRILDLDVIPAHVLADIPEHDRQLMELEENIQRKDITWQERCSATQRITDMLATDGWTQEQVSHHLGVTPVHLSRVLTITRAIETEEHKDLAKIGSMQTAMNALTRRRKRTVSSGLEEFLDKVAGKEERVRHERGEVITGDFISWAAKYSGPRFNLIHCDFPYGVAFQKSMQHTDVLWNGYEDDAASYWDLCRALVGNKSRLMAACCHFIFWLSMSLYVETLEFFRASVPEIVWNPAPLIWHKTDGTSVLPDPKRSPRIAYDAAIFGSKGDRLIAQVVTNCIGYPSDRAHALCTSERPKNVHKHFLRMVVDSNTLMLDPTCGSGTMLAAALELGAKAVTGVELNPTSAGYARQGLPEASDEG